MSSYDAHFRPGDLVQIVSHYDISQSALDYYSGFLNFDPNLVGIPALVLETSEHPHDWVKIFCAGRQLYFSSKQLVKCKL